MDTRIRIVTGQQIGAGWTPALSVVKALAALVEARRRGGRALFWMADEDHDRLEVASTVALTEGRLERHRLAFRAPEGTGTGWLPWTDVHQKTAEAWWGPLPAPLEPTLRGHFLALGGALWRRGLEPYSPTETSDRSTIQPELERWRALDLERDLLLQAERLQEAGLPLPLDPRTQAAWFSLDPASGLRQRLEAGDSLGRGLWLSPGAALRPLMQSLLLAPTAAMLGPAERAYWRLAEPLWERVGLEPPEILKRPSLYVLPAGLALGVQDLPVLRDGSWEAWAPERAASGTAGVLQADPGWSPDLRRRFETEVARFTARLGRLDRRQAREAAARRLGVDPERVRQALFPLGRAQERVLPGWTWLKDETLLDRMEAALAGPGDIVLVEEP